MGLFSRKSSSTSNDSHTYDPVGDAASDLNQAFEAARRGDRAARDRHTANAQKHIDASKRR